MSSLLRTRVGRFDLSDARTISELQELYTREKRENGGEYSFVYPLRSFFTDRPVINVTPDLDRAVYNGNRFYLSQGSAADNPEDDGEVCVYSSSGEFIGIYYRRGEEYSPVRMFYSPS